MRKIQPGREEQQSGSGWGGGGYETGCPCLRYSSPCCPSSKTGGREEEGRECPKSKTPFLNSAKVESSSGRKLSTLRKYIYLQIFKKDGLRALSRWRKRGGRRRGKKEEAKQQCSSKNGSKHVERPLDLIEMTVTTRELKGISSFPARGPKKKGRKGAGTAFNQRFHQGPPPIRPRTYIHREGRALGRPVCVGRDGSREERTV